MSSAHSIVIAHRDMNAYLAWTLWSIRRSAESTGIDDYEVFVIDGGSQETPQMTGPHETLIRFREPMGTFNKPKLLNAGIDVSRGDVLTFLDADMLVGKSWLAGIRALRDPVIIRLCYRVRRLSTHRWLQLQHSTDREKIVTWLFRRYDHFDLAFEAWGRHNHNWQPETAEERRRPFGNSQFSVTRADLADLRPNEAMVGHGTEDLEFNQQFERRYGERYQGKLDTYPPYCLFHLPHEHVWEVERLPRCRQAAIVGADGAKYDETLRYGGERR